MIRQVRVDGRRDLRALPVALAVWTGQLAGNRLVDMLEGSATVTRVTFWCAAAGFIMLFGGIGAAVAYRYRYARRPGPVSNVSCPSYAGMVMLLTVAGLLVGVLTVHAHRQSQAHDPAIRYSQSDTATLVSMEASVNTPLTASSVRGYDCQADIIITRFNAGRSHAPARVFAVGQQCASLDHGMRVRFQASLSPARYGSQPVWATDMTALTIISQPNAPRALANRMRHRFAATTARLSDQGRILVPGVTCGMLGQSYAGPADTGEIDTTYANQVEQEFRDAGIMHLMAVSGGHFILIAQLVLWACAACRMPRWAAALAVLIAYHGLAGLVYPSHSVLRALAMGWFSSLAMLAGRRHQAVSALSWSVILILVIDPSKATSYGFALSAAAVLGITLLNEPIERLLACRLPRTLAQAVSITIAAQALTLPIQILMEPSIPLLSTLANLLVAPFVSWSTITGLIALILAPFAPPIAFAAAWLSSCGTAVMAWVAHACGSPAWASLAWPSGIRGSLLALAAAIMMMSIIAAACRLRGNGTGTRYRRPAGERITTWLTETRAMLDDSWQSTPRTDTSPPTSQPPA